MTTARNDIEAQLRRQSLWLKDSWLWLLENRIGRSAARKPTALDVGCGPGFVMDVLSPLLDVKGVDSDHDMVESCRGRGLDAVRADANELPFEDGAFDIVYCSFLLLWLKDPGEAVSEMKRVSRHWIACLAEPDYGGRLNYPESLDRIDDLVVGGIKEQGADPFVGRKLRSIFAGCGLEADVGVHPGVWGTDRLRTESRDEMRWIEMTGGSKRDEKAIGTIRSEWDKALGKGELFQFNPIFYAFAEK